MIDRRKSDFRDYNWKFMTIDEKHNGYQYVDGLNIADTTGVGDNMIFAGGNFIFNNFNETHVFIRNIEIPVGAQISQSTKYDHAYESDKLILDKRLDLRNSDTWEILWDNFVDIMSFKEKILYVISKNGWISPLIWLINKIRTVHSEDPHMIAETVLRGAISSNNVDIIEYIVKEYPEIPKTMGSNSLIMGAIAELAIAPDKQSDYCYPSMKSIIDSGLFSEVDPSIILSPYIVMFQTMNHDGTCRLIQSYINKKVR